MENHSKKYICHLKQPYSFHHRKLRKTFHGMCWLVERGLGKLERKKTPQWYLWCSKWATKTFSHICWLMAGYAIQKWRNTLDWKSDVMLRNLSWRCNHTTHRRAEPENWRPCPNIHVAKSAKPILKMQPYHAAKGRSREFKTVSK